MTEESRSTDPIPFRRAGLFHRRQDETPDMSDADKSNIEVHELKFYVQRNIRYHMRRAAFFMRWGRFTAFVGVLFGSAAITSILAKAPAGFVTAAALVVTIASAIDLVVGTGQRAWLHNDLRKRYLDIEAELLSCAGTPSAEQLCQYRSRIRRIEADEPPTLPALEILARNDVIRSMYPKAQADELVSRLSWLKRTTAQWFDWDTSNA
ncbi:hypothetical protein CDO47_05835 [Pseudomonas aeruginosa]|nr:hypothetical protein CDO47_05835 [Pseudomonas aeruginosa]